MDRELDGSPLMSEEVHLLSRDLFVQHAKEALAGLNSPLRLELNPLASLLSTEQPTGLTAAQAMRQVIREAIEALRPDPDVPADHPDWVSYQLLRQRYLQGISQIATCQQLGLSRATFYRRHRQLAEVVAEMLWQRYRHRVSVGHAAGDTLAAMSPDERAREEAIKLARRSQRTLLHPRELLQGAIDTVRPLAEQQGIRLSLHCPSELPLIHGDPLIFRQIVLNVLTEGIKLAARRSLELLVTPEEQRIVYELRGLDAITLEGLELEGAAGFVVSRGLLEVCGGRLWLDGHAPAGPALRFAIPVTAAPVILVIEDDADTADLYRRYLEIHGYVLRTVRTGAEAYAALAEARPDLILLDVLMPKQDGWEILQQLKTMPETSCVPVVICSVLSQPQLALALGAAQVLRKPITADRLVETVRMLLEREDT